MYDPVDDDVIWNHGLKVPAIQFSAQNYLNWQ